MRQTALLAGEAVADAEILTTVLKDATSRLRPAGIPPRGNFSDTCLKAAGQPSGEKGSFPSGHTIAAFSIATVIARRYGNHRWVPYAAYGDGHPGRIFEAFVIGPLSLSDVFMGGALGYSISRFTVLRQ